MEYLTWILIALLAIDFVAGSLADRRQWSEIASRRAGIRTLRKRTGIWDRAELERRFGAPDQSFTFNVTRENVRRARTIARRVFDARWIDLALFSMACVGVGVALSCGCPYTFALSITMVPVFYRCLIAGHDLLMMALSHSQRAEEVQARYELAGSGTA